jgi:uncharacterized protein YbbC (DUF1343 family)
MNSLFNRLLFISVITLLCSFSSGQGNTQVLNSGKPRFVNIESIQCGDERTDSYFPELEGKNIALVCNQTSLVKGVHLVDTLVSAGFKVRAIFSPEHGFRGDAEAGAEITGGTDSRTGIRIISLYGKNKKPSPSELDGIDLVLFDIQDVGVRFYTYINTLTNVMEASAESGIPVIVLDRPNPNGFYVDGPVLDSAFKSFVGIYPVPIVYGMTIGEYARMVNGEGWLAGKPCDLTVIPVEGYQHNMIVSLNVKPSPNLPTWQSIYLYPSLCLFEGTMISVGRGTDKPFQIIGHPDFLIGSYTFTPKSIPGIAEHPPYENQVCYGQNLTGFAENYLQIDHPFTLTWLIGMHDIFKDSAAFFNPYFDKLAGNDKLRKDIINRKTEQEIRSGWENDLVRFRQIRKKYLLYPE